VACSYSLFLVIIFIYSLFLNDYVYPICLMENCVLCNKTAVGKAARISSIFSYNLTEEVSLLFIF